MLFVLAGQPIAVRHICKCHAGCEKNKVHRGKVDCWAVVLPLQKAVALQTLPRQHQQTVLKFHHYKTCVSIAGKLYY